MDLAYANRLHALQFAVDQTPLHKPFPERHTAALEGPATLVLQLKKHFERYTHSFFRQTAPYHWSL
jgi:hypothetical protein